MVSTPREPASLGQSIRDAFDSAIGNRDTQYAIDSYRWALFRSWDRMEMVVGRGGAAAVIGHAAGRVARGCPEAALVQVGEDGIDLSRLEARMLEENPEGYRECLAELCAAVLETLGELTGDVLLAPLLAEIQGRQPD